MSGRKSGVGGAKVQERKDWGHRGKSSKKGKGERKRGREDIEGGGRSFAITAANTRESS